MEEGKNQDLLDLLKRAAENDEAARAELLKRGREWVNEVITTEFAQSGFSHEELFHSGYLGLLSAVYNADLSRGKDFFTYARNIIRGEIRQYIRERTRRSQFPRFLTDLNRQVEAVEARLLKEKGRLPTLTELADAVNVTEEGLTEIFKAREAINYVSLSAERRRTDPAPTVDLSKIRNKRPEPFPIQYRIRIASALERLSHIQETLTKSLFPPSQA
ncbi:hypothetical protein DRJ12_02860 [Candidatus Acetothermia bacterium]|nr:MAG: hypothetical protein DRJ12_02860 [Candidatus Acetothermia bacterium]